MDSDLNNLVARMNKLKESKQKNSDELIRVQTELRYKKDEFEQNKQLLLDKYGIEIKGVQDIERYQNEYKQRVTEGIETAEQLIKDANGDLN